MRKFLLLGGKPIGSYDIAKYAKSKGAHVIVCDYLDDSQSMAKQIANEQWSYSTADLESILERASAEAVDCIFTGVHEFNLKQCQNICSKMNLPFYASENEIVVSSQKHIYKEIFKRNGIDVIPEFNISSDSSYDEFEFPVIIKPVDSSGAYGINICNNKQELKSCIRDSLKYSTTGKVIAERYIENKEEITIVYFLVDGNPYLASVADRFVKSFDNNIIPLPVGYIWPSKFLGLYSDCLDAKMQKSIREMGLQNGMLFIQAIVKENVIYPYDIGFRLSGTQEHLVLESICGYNPLKLLTDFSFDGYFKNKSELLKKINPHFKEYACNITFLAKPSKIHKFVGIDEVRKMPGVIRVVKNKLEGEVIPKSALGTLNQVVLRIFAKAENLENLKRTITLVTSKISVLDESSNNVLIKKTIF